MTVIMRIGRIKHTKDLKGIGESINDFLHGQNILVYNIKQAMKKGYNEWKKYKKTFGRNRLRETKFSIMDFYNTEMQQKTIQEDDIEWFEWTIESQNKDFEEDQYKEALKIYESPKVMTSLRKLWDNTKRGIKFLEKYGEIIESGEKEIKEKHKTIQNKLLDCGILTDIKKID